MYSSSNSEAGKAVDVYSVALESVDEITKEMTVLEENLENFDFDSIERTVILNKLSEYERELRIMELIKESSFRKYRRLITGLH